MQLVTTSDLRGFHEQCDASTWSSSDFFEVLLFSSADAREVEMFCVELVALVLVKF